MASADPALGAGSNGAVHLMHSDEYCAAVGAPLSVDDATVMLRSAENAFLERHAAWKASRGQPSTAAATAAAAPAAAKPGRTNLLASLVHQKTAMAAAAAEAAKPTGFVPVTGLERAQDPMLLAHRLRDPDTDPWTSEAGKNLQLIAAPADVTVAPGRALAVAALVSTTHLPGAADKIFMPFALVPVGESMDSTVQCIATLRCKRVEARARAPPGALRLDDTGTRGYWVEVGFKQRKWTAPRRYLPGDWPETLSPGNKCWLRIAVAPTPTGHTEVWVFLNGHLLVRNCHPPSCSLTGKPLSLVVPASGDYGERVTTQVHGVWRGDVAITPAMMKAKYLLAPATVPGAAGVAGQ